MVARKNYVKSLTSHAFWKNKQALMTPFQPLLAAKTSEEDLAKLNFPLLWSPKLDGIRTLIHDIGPVTRKIKLVPNEALRKVLHQPELAGFDGETIYGPHTDKDVFNRTQSAVMKVAGPCPHEADGQYLVFDDFTSPNDPFSDRFARLTERVSKLGALGEIVKLVPHGLVHNLDDLMNCERIAVERGYEGIMGRDPGGPYKFGRSTLKAQTLFKIKRFADAEATIEAVEELYHNENEAEKDALGHTKRATHAEHQVAGGTMGSLVLSSPDFVKTFKLGTGFSAAVRQDLWDRREEIVGKVVCFKYQPSGMKDLPRFPSFKGFRKD